MPETKSEQSANEPRIARLERSIFWLKIGLAVVMVAVVALFIPPLAAAIGLVLFAIAVGGGVVVFITAAICVLDRLFPGPRAKS
jgi:4-hydroxybenzoate polyprenyltransferase